MTDAILTLNTFIAKNRDRIPSFTDEELYHFLFTYKYRFPDSFARIQKSGIFDDISDVSAFREELTVAISGIEQKLTQLDTPEDTSVSSEEVARRAVSFTEATNKGTQAVSNHKTKMGESSIAYARELGKNFTEQVESALEREIHDAAALEAQKVHLKNLQDRAETVRTPREVREYTQSLAGAVTVAADQKNEALRIAQDQARGVRTEFENRERIYTQSQKAFSEAKRIALTSSTIEKPDVFISKALEISETKDLPVETIVLAAETHEWSVVNGTAASNVTFGGHDFFQKIGGPTVAAKIRDTVFNGLSPTKQAAIIKDVIDRSLEKVEQPVRHVTTHQLVRDAIRRGDSAIGASTAAESASGLLGMVFKPATINPQTLEAIGHSGGLEWLNSHALYTLMVRDKVKREAGKFILKEGAKEGAKKLGLKGVLSAITTAIGLTGPQGLIAKLALDVVVDRVFNGAVAIVGGVGEFFTKAGGWVSLLKSEELPLGSYIVAVPAMVVIVLVGMFAFPWFLNTITFSDNVRLAALATTLQGGIGPGGPTIDCTKEPDKSSPACILTQCKGDCQWPLDPSSGACIIEGPFVGTHSDCRLSGIDFVSPGDQGKLFGAPVYTPYAGVVEQSVFGFDDNSGYEGNKDGGTYGNHVIVKTNDGGHLLFAHLRNIQTVKKGDSVAAKAVVGFVDHTGYSYDVHLHYEAWGPGCPRSGVDINKYTPFPVPPCEGYADCEAKLQAAGHDACIK